MNISLAVALFCCAVVSSGVLVEVIRQWALRREKFDVPNERSSHSVPTPRGGGLAIVVVTLTGWLFVNVFVWHRFDANVWAYPLGAALIAAVSWIDDLCGLSNSVRFVAHSVAAIIAIAVYGYWRYLFYPGWSDWNVVSLGATGALLTFLWIVWLTNAYNFMDGIDGIAGLQALVAGLGWFEICLSSDIFSLGVRCIPLLSLIIAGSSLGFLIHNRPPARIFMGDVGSAFVGYSFAIMPLLLRVDMLPRQPDTGLFLFYAVILVWPFLFDTIFTFMRRAIKGENVFKAHRSHLFQRLVIAGCSHRFVTLLYGALACEGAFFAIAWINGRPTLAYKLWLPLLASMLGLWLFTCWREKRAAARR